MTAWPTSSSAPLETVRVAVLFGGSSSEREVSLSSGRAVVEALAEGGLPREVREVPIDAQDRWLVDGAALAPHRALARLEAVDVFFLALHGAPGEDGTIQGFLDTAGVRYTGSGVRASALSMDKQALRLLAVEAGLRVAPGLTVSAREWREAGPTALGRVHGVVGERAVVKPRCGGSSVGTAIVAARDDALAPAVEAALGQGDDALIEAFVPGVEVSVGVLGNSGGDLRALPPIEIRPAEGRFFDYQQKYDPAGARELCPAESLDPEDDRRLREAALLAHRVAGCDGYSRVDFIVPARRATGDRRPVLLEVNTLPGLTPRSLLPQEARVTGLDFRGLCLEILSLALSR